MGCVGSAVSLHAISWNIAAINNNPFEYWMTIEGNDIYNKLMNDVGEIMKHPTDEVNILVKDIFSETMVKELLQLMEQIGWTGLDETLKVFNDDFAQRKIITGFMHDEEIGAKRLTSMPDRISNTINLPSGSQIYRPTVINCYNKRISNLSDWFEQWKSFMFKDKITVAQKGKETETTVALMLQPIRKAKYPAITEEEEKISLPLQVVSLAIFDAILIHIVESVTKGAWQDVRAQVCEALNVKKNDKILEILSSEPYANVDVMFLQEVALTFIQRAQSIQSLKDTFHMVTPEGAGGRDQLSAIFIRKSAFDVSTVKEVTQAVSSKLPKDAPVEPGDILSITVVDRTDEKNFWFLTSFHGDTNGLATIPVLQSVYDHMKQDLASNKPFILFGLDANVYEKGKQGKLLGVSEFAAFYRSIGLTSTWGAEPNPSNYTTCNARTYLQPQLNKAVTREEIKTKGDVNPKDFILFDPSQLKSLEQFKDNTGKKKYIEDMPFPTLEFPSDHGIIGATLESA